ncbi:response regulator [Flavobacterium sp.]|uniref:response regulator n=1 Tax=Flavobacterium sp. TaxID=239 RepID=UPI0011FD8F5B|nr:response regulator [Flavobacterium sp.]RZJ72562.1 MAG: response regulator [Flavobacterium sp.]
MSKKGPILLIEDDLNDVDVIVSALKENSVKNVIKHFGKAQDALDYLAKTTEQPFLVISDIMMNTMNGLELRKTIDENEFLRKKSIPFIFLTQAVSQDVVDEAYDLTVQGFFEKGNNYEDVKKQLDCMVSYWSKCVHPNSF